MITVAALIYRSRRWLDFVWDGLHTAQTSVAWRPWIVANDATPAVAADPRISHHHRNSDPTAPYLPRVYAAWNAAVQTAPTELVVLLNSDMYVSDGWLDALVTAYHQHGEQVVPTSLLVEHGHIPSRFPEYVHDFGRVPDRFDREAWQQHARTLVAHAAQTDATTPGRLYMPVLLSKTAWRAVGGYPLGNIGGVSGDQQFFELLAWAGWAHITVMDSVVYHVQTGEMGDDADV